jgi:hypothetical protein
MVRKGYSLDTASDETGLPEDTIKAHLGGVLYKRGGFWNAKHNDKIQRRMHIYSEGEIKEINVSNFLDASKLGKYFVNVQKALRTNDDAFLEKYRRKGIRDSSGKTHYFELDLEKLREIEEGKEDPEYWQVYVYE